MRGAGASQPRTRARDPHARPRIRRRLRVIALGLVLLPTLAVALLVRAALESDERAQQRLAAERRQRVEARALDLAGRLAARPELFGARRREPLALRELLPPVALRGPIDVDGDCGDWQAAATDAGPGDAQSPCGPGIASLGFATVAPWLGRDADAADDLSFRLSAGMRDEEGYLYLFLDVRDDDVRVRRGGIGADQLRLAVSLPWGEEAMLPARFVTALERGGDVTTYQVDPAWTREATEERQLGWGDYRAPAWRRPYGVWHATDAGYALELRLPLRALGPRWREARLGLAVMDVDGEADAAPRVVWVEPRPDGVFGARSTGATRFEREWPASDRDLRGRRIALFDASGGELFASFAAEDAADPMLRTRARELLHRLHGSAERSLVHPEAALAAARIEDDRGRTLGFALEDAGREPPSRSLADVVRESPSLAAVLGAALLLLFLLLAYTGRLSRRILALVGDVGADRDADDEIGELSRRLSDLVEQVRADRAYLERLPSILGHETLGPLGVVKMFLDDLEGRDLPKQEAARRALRSVEELIEDLREATSLEEALARGERLEADLVELVRASVQAYAESQGAAIQLELPRSPAGFRTRVIEGRVEQLLDKLLDNAVGFSTGESVRVALRVEAAPGQVRIRVENQGPPLPEGPAAQLFEPMWSQRRRTSERHLGMGLYVARVIAERHGGTITARNEPPDRVVFEVTLRRALE